MLPDTLEATFENYQKCLPQKWGARRAILIIAVPIVILLALVSVHSRIAVFQSIEPALFGFLAAGIAAIAGLIFAAAIYEGHPLTGLRDFVRRNIIGYRLNVNLDGTQQITYGVRRQKSGLEVSFRIGGWDHDNAISDGPRGIDRGPWRDICRWQIKVDSVYRVEQNNLLMFVLLTDLYGVRHFMNVPWALSILDLARRFKKTTLADVYALVGSQEEEIAEKTTLIAKQEEELALAKAGLEQRQAHLMTARSGIRGAVDHIKGSTRFIHSIHGEQARVQLLATLLAITPEGDESLPALLQEMGEALAPQERRRKSKKPAAAPAADAALVPTS